MDIVHSPREFVLNAMDETAVAANRIAVWRNVALGPPPSSCRYGCVGINGMIRIALSFISMWRPAEAMRAFYSSQPPSPPPPIRLDWSSLTVQMGIINMSMTPLPFQFLLRAIYCLGSSLIHQ